jgi:hypothetical protein
MIGRCGSFRHAMRGDAVDIHKLVLFLVLTVGAGALTYNAVSIVNGDGGLAGLTTAADGQQLARHPF